MDRLQPVKTDIGLLTWNTCEEQGILEQCADRLQWPVKVAGRGTVLDGMHADYGQNDWYRVMSQKLGWTIDALHEMDHEFIMGCDDYDVLLMSPPESLTTRLGDGMIFASESNPWPKLNILKEYREFERESLSISRYVYLNAGVWMGKREFLIEFFQRCAEVAKHIQAQTEQGEICLCRNEYRDTVLLDHKREWFFVEPQPIPALRALHMLKEELAYQ